MKWKRATTTLRLACLVLATGSAGAAWFFRWVSISGIETVPPLFILLALLGALAFLGVAAAGRYPSP